MSGSSPMWDINFYNMVYCVNMCKLGNSFSLLPPQSFIQTLHMHHWSTKIPTDACIDCMPSYGSSWEKEFPNWCASSYWHTSTQEPPLLYSFRRVPVVGWSKFCKNGQFVCLSAAVFQWIYRRIWYILYVCQLKNMCKFAFYRHQHNRT